MSKKRENVKFFLALAIVVCVFYMVKRGKIATVETKTFVDKGTLHAQRDRVVNDPSPGNKMAKRGMHLVRSGDLKAAIKLLEDGLTIYPSNDNAWHWLGHAYAKERENKKALDAHIRALQLKPNSWTYQASVGGAHFNLWQMVQASENTEKAIGLCEQDPGCNDKDLSLLYAGHSRELYYLGELDAAKDYADRAIELDPESTFAIDVKDAIEK